MCVLCMWVDLHDRERDLSGMPIHAGGEHDRGLHGQRIASHWIRCFIVHNDGSSIAERQQREKEDLRRDEYEGLYPTGVV